MTGLGSVLPSPHLSHAGVVGFMGVEVLVNLLSQLSVHLGATSVHNGNNNQSATAEKKQTVCYDNFDLGLGGVTLVKGGNHCVFFLGGRLACLSRCNRSNRDPAGCASQ